MTADPMDRPWPLPTGRVAFGPSAPEHCKTADLSTGESAHLSTGRRLVLAGPEPLIESLHWRDVAAGDMPPDDRTVLLLGRHADGKRGWDAGWWAADEKVWRLCESGGECGAEVLFWSSPNGPEA